MTQHSLEIRAGHQAGIAQRQDPETAAARLRHLLLSPLASQPERNEVASLAAALSAPANPVWILARVAALLNPYYEKDTPQAVREMLAEDWIAALIGQPEWAITAAVRWWKGPDNPDRRKAPIEGDIAARVRIETDAVRASKIRVEAFDRRSSPKPAALSHAPLTAEQRRALAVSLGMPDMSAMAKTFPATGEAAE